MLDLQSKSALKILRIAKDVIFQILHPERVVQTATVSAVILVCFGTLIHSAQKNTSSVRWKVPMFSVWLRQ